MLGRHRPSVRLFALAAIVATADCRSDNRVTDVPEIDPAIARIAIAGPSSIQLYIGGRAVATIVAFDARGNTLSSPPVQWVSDNPTIADVGSSGIILGKNVGTTLIHARAGKLSADLAVTVAFVAAMTLLPRGEFGDTIQLAPGQTLQFSHLEYDRQTTAQQQSQGVVGNWESSDPTIAAVSDSGLVTARTAGNTRVTLAFGSVTDSRVIRVAPTAGSASLQIVNADPDGPLQFRSNSGRSTIPLDFGAVHEQTIAAGTLFVTADGVQPTSPPWCNCFDGQQPIQQFLGFLPNGSKLTLVATHNAFGYAMVPLWGWDGPIASDIAVVRVVWAVSETYAYSYNVYLADVAAPMSNVFLVACYLDWPYAVTGYSARPARPFDIILQRAKFGTESPEATRLTVTPVAGSATTYIITGSGPAAFHVMAVPDPK
jgi:hypothetical protein